MSQSNTFDIRFEVGLQVWRVYSNTNVVKVHEKSVTYESESCYLVSLNERKSWNFQLFAWIGKQNTLETLTREMCRNFDSVISDYCTRNNMKFEFTVHYEQEGSESEIFKSTAFISQKKYAFPKIRLRSQTNLRDEKHTNCLYKIMGARQFFIKIVELSYVSLNENDAYVLDLQSKIYQWQGRKCSIMKKSKAFDLSKRLRDERMNYTKSEVISVRQGEEDEDFWRAVGGSVNEISTEAPASDAEIEKAYVNCIKVYRVKRDSAVELVELNGQIPKKQLLSENFIYILDFQEIIFVWIYRGCESAYKNEAFAFSEELLKRANRPSWVQIHRVVEKLESTLFKAMVAGNYEEFVDTPEQYKNRLDSISKVSKIGDTKINVDAMHHPEKYEMEKEVDHREEVMPFYMPQTEMKIWYILDNDKLVVPAKEVGIFYSQHAYVIMLRCRSASSESKNYLFYWFGRYSSKKDKRVATFLTIDLANRYRSTVSRTDCMMTCIEQGREPNYFLSYFRGYYTVRNGCMSEWSKQHKDRGVLLQVKNQCEQFKFSQVSTLYKFLNSRSVFVLCVPEQHVLCWSGKTASVSIRDFVLQGISKRISTRASQICNESDDKNTEIWYNLDDIVDDKEKVEYVGDFNSSSSSIAQSFWKHVGGSGKIDDDGSYFEGLEDCKIKGFVLSNIGTAALKQSFVQDFTQDDLQPDEMFMLDVYYEIFLWIGSKCSETFKEQAVSCVLEYVDAAKDGRQSGAPIYLIAEGKEPRKFIRFFYGWTDAESRSVDDYDFLETLDDSSKIQALAEKSKSVANCDIVEYWKLKLRPPPENVDQLNLENYLSKSQFEEVFKMTFSEYRKLPKWKMIQLKKLYNLF